ncbi:MAG: Ppx/GppA phosphatase family protein [Ruminiclostridium sp.]
MNDSITKHNILAAIYINSCTIKMKLADVDTKGVINTLETPRKFINLGKDTFVTGMIKHEHVEDICSILKSFKRLISEYDTDKYMIVATSALREANNCDYILDYIHQRTGFKIKLISESEERFFTYSAIIDKLKNFPELKQEGVLITNVGSEGVEITLFNEGDLIFTQYIKMGSLRLKEILSVLEKKTLNFPNLIGEYIESEMDMLKALLLKKPIKNFLVIGSEIHVIHDILQNNKKEYSRSFMTKETFYNIYYQIIGKSQQQIMNNYLLNTENAETLVPAMLIYEKFLSFTISGKIYTPAVSLCDGLIQYMVDKKYHMENKAISEKDIITSVKKLGEKYSYDAKHAQHVELISLELFDNSRRLHGYSDKERLLLQIAAIAHDFGKFINIKAHNVLSYNIMLNSEILGLSDKEMLITANIIKYHAIDMPFIDDINYISLDCESRIIISKLAAYLKIADSLDRSHRQKLSDFKIVFNDFALTIMAETSQDVLLEQWEYENKSNLFRQVYGIKPSLIIKRK